MIDIRGVWPIIDKLKNGETWRRFFYKGVSGLRRVKRVRIILTMIIIYGVRAESPVRSLTTGFQPSRVAPGNTLRL